MPLNRCARGFTRRGFLAATAGLALGGCASGPAADTAAGGDFDVTVDGKLGPAVLNRLPQRVIALSFGQDADAAVALGVVPIAMARGSSTPSGIQPWVEPLLGGAHPELLRLSESVPLEQVAALEPDLFLAVGDHHLESYHDTLGKMAPVLSYVTGPNLDQWPETTRRVGRVLGREDRAAQVISETERKIAEARTGAALGDRTFTFSSVGGGQVFTKNDPADVLAVSLAQYGIRLSPAVTSLPATGTKGIAGVSLERLDLLDADLVLVSYQTAAQRQTFEAEPLFAGLSAVRRGSYVALDQAEAQALAFPSALAAAYTAEHTVPKLAAAAK
ncbi:ABC transporter substrate-binding protein [Nocardia crassostreae]|uniref:ABC transporter substrate-binding protein n=1 Tax=Nocardia crassostreae TaxID=53428 RepID=UPI00082A9100|nr:ABC transporter substrate-binding protein [Nocardia crassostreae]